MAKREKIILAVMASILLYGAVDFLLLGKGKDPASLVRARTAEIEKFLVDASKNMPTGETGRPRDDYFIITQASSQWENDPFFKGDLAGLMDKSAEKPPELKAEDLGLKYTGYLEVGARKIAIINGQEYFEGEEIVVGIAAIPYAAERDRQLGGSVGGLQLGGNRPKDQEQTIPDVLLVKSISPTHVILNSKDGGNKVLVPMEEMDR
ncbi:MAG: hypothetical protein V1816_20470 [Pseudomonadota bacterium]